jgi:[acyl-carrier-protein] S-malonyltransferase
LSKKAFIFPGQASQFVGMGKDLNGRLVKAKEVFQQANEIMGMDLAAICFEGPEEKLKQTNITQPAIFVHSMAVHSILEKNKFEADAVAGHSLGEYSALVAAGALSFADGLKLVKIRGDLMQQAGKKRPGTMAAIIGLDPDQIAHICAATKNVGIVCPANYNSPGQIAISGEVSAVHEAMTKAKDAGAKKVVELIVSGAFHSPLMEHAQEGLAQALKETEINEARIPVFSNVTATATTHAAEIRNLLYQQLTNPVRWLEIIENMVTSGITEFYEVGPGKVLCGLNKRINREFICYGVGTVSELEGLKVI